MGALVAVILGLVACCLWLGILLVTGFNLGVLGLGLLAYVALTQANPA